MNEHNKVLKIRLLFCFLLLCSCFLSCSSDKKPLLKGRWEMRVENFSAHTKESYGVDTLVYVIELDTEQRTYVEMSDLLENGLCYGYMDFSNLNRFYRYGIDSVAYLGEGTYLVKMIDLVGSPWEPEVSLDTLRYNSITKQLEYNKWVFNYVPDLKPFKGEWTVRFDDTMSEDVCLSLYEKIKAPTDYPFHGEDCYGYLIYYSDVDNSYRLITSVKSIHYDRAEVTTVFPDYPQDPPQTHTLYFNRKTGGLSLDNAEYYLFPKDGYKPGIKSEKLDFLNDGITLSLFYLSLIMLVVVGGLRLWNGSHQLNYWISVVLLLIESVLAFILVGMVVAAAGNVDMGAARGLGEVAKLYGGALLIAAVFLFCFSWMLKWQSQYVKKCNQTFGIIAYGLAIVPPLLSVFGGHAFMDALAGHFFQSLCYEQGLLPFLGALCLVLVMVCIIVQTVIFAMQLRGVYRLVTTIIYPICAVASIMLLMVATLIVVYLVIVGAVIFFFLSIISEIYKKPNISHVIDKEGKKHKVKDVDVDILGNKQVRTEDGKEFKL